MSGVTKSIVKVVALTLGIVGVLALLFGLSIAQEVPTGTVRGRVLGDNSAPLARATVVINDETDKYFRAITDADGYFIITDVPEGKYTGYAAARGYETGSLRDGKAFMVIEGGTTDLVALQLAPRPPQLYGGIQSVFMPGEKVKFSLNGYSRYAVAEVSYSVYKFDYPKFIRANSGRDNDEGRLSGWKNLGKPVVERQVRVRTDSEGYFSREVGLPVKGIGGYLVHVKMEGTEALHSTIITDLALVAKRAPDKMLIYAVSFTKKQPLPGVNIEFFSDGGKLATTGRTDSNGLFMLDRVPNKSIVVLATSGESSARTYSYSGESDEAHKCYIYTDRPVYRPGHMVYFKGILRKSTPGSYATVANRPVSVKITDPDGQAIKKLQLETNARGTFNGEVTLDPEAATGYYRVEAEYAGETHERMFKVEEYSKPEYKASIKFAKPHYVGGEDAEASVEAAYYFGGPVAGARVTYTVYKSPDYFYYYPEEESDTSFYEDFLSESESGEYYGGYGEVVLESEGVTDENGLLKISIPTEKESREQRYSVEATVTDASGRGVEMSGGVMVTPGLFKLQVSTDRYVSKPNEPVKVTVYAVDYDRKTVGNVRVTVSADMHVEGGRLRGRTRRIDRREITLDSRGRGVVEFRPKKQGELKIRVDATDRQGNKVADTSWLWVADETWGGEGYEAPALELTLDKKLYSVGDTAKIVINSPAKDSYILFTIEGRRLFDQRVIHLTSSTRMIEVPIRAEYMPNAFASVCLISGKKSSTASKPILVTPRENFLTVKLASDKPRYLPGETATYRITTLDHTGKGVPAEVSLGVVDESVYAIREDKTPNIQRFFYAPVWNMVETSFSFSEDYYGGEDKFQGKVRKYFPDTAYWNPTIMTDSGGGASVSFKMPDNLTTWRATARAVTSDTRVGGAIHKVIVTKNLMVRMQTPRFFRQRDDITLSAVVHNYTDREQSVRVWLKVTGIRIDGDTARTIKIASNGVGRVEWQAEVPSVGTAKVTVYAQGQGDQDAMEMEVPVLAHGVPENVSDSGEVNGTSAEFALNVPPGIVKEAGGLEMGFAPSVAGAALGITQAVEDYRYESAEGIMDILLPNVVMYQAMKQLGASSSEQIAKIRKLVDHDLKNIYNWQLPGGGWGWDQFGGKDEWMTAYVVYGLMRAKQAGLPVRDDVIKLGIKATLDALPDVGDLGKRATMVYVLALAGKANPAWVDKILADKKLQNYSLALMILSLNEMSQRDRARSLVPKLIKGATVTRMHCFWPEMFEWGFYSCNRYETTAYALRALLAVDPENPCVVKAVRWLIASRKGDRYDANYDTASVVYGLADYLIYHKAPTPDYTARAYVNGKLVREFSMTPADLYRLELRVKLPSSVIREGRNVIKIEKIGVGELFYWANLTYYPAGENLPRRDGRISIYREYYRLNLVKDPKEGLVYKPVPLGDTARVGELIRCKITIVSPKDFQYLKVDDMLPSGCEIVQRAHDSFYDEYDYSWDYWWSGETPHDNRMSFSIAGVHKGRRSIEYDFRPEIKGTFHVMPAVAQGAFEPDIYAHTDERRLVVR
ncbi:MAG: MG2 domain-containing protein [Armatimonadetes bacterium]|nr:MG2 domain-containing protein [Armatimonadota bacterium]